ncbi:acyl-CoA dehydrogenase family protein [Actinoallomurus sp. CA-142502]|uniref:acyl-CoA dehydrogenase family protein n=1 Tax=Actinoallomurus sp. CA-142502 TaxID=3239885 RepID=UPI003D92F3EA
MTKGFGVMIEERVEKGEERSRLVDAARALAPVLLAHSDCTEQRRRLAGESLVALHGAGLLRLGTPRALGGHGATVGNAIAVCAELARACASSSWIVGIAYGGALFASQLRGDVREKVWAAGPDRLVCGAANPSGTVRRVPGGVALTGRWPWISGIRHASWVLLGIEWGDADAVPERGLALVSADEVKVAETWHMAGMCGTGSETAVAEELFVPDTRLLSFAEIASGVGVRRHPGEARVTFPLSINLPLVGTGIGIAQATLEHVVRSLVGGKRGPSPLFPEVANAPAHQLNVADAATLIDTARLHVFSAAEELDQAAREGHRPDLEARARLRMAGSHAMRCARDAVGLLLDTAGAGASPTALVCSGPGATWKPRPGTPR